MSAEKNPHGRFVLSERNKRVLEVCRANPTLSSQEIAVLVGEVPEYCATRISRLRKRGLLPDRAENIRLRTSVGAPPESLLPVLAGLTAPERRRILEEIAKTGAEATKISAIRALEELDRQAGGSIGPKPPLSVAEKVNRLARLMLAVGPSIVEQARVAAFPPTEAPLEVETLPSAPESRESPAGAGPMA